MEKGVTEITGQSEAGASLDLDHSFGLALEPSYTEPLELKVKPRSLQKLDSESADLLKQLMDATIEGLLVSQYTYCELPILWVVDRDGDIWFSIEEIVKEETHEFVHPRLSGATFPTDARRLGHPSLISAAAGRIGGEILFDNEEGSMHWVITNGSGRYGMRAGRTAEHLRSAAEEFRKHDIAISDSFIPVKRRDES